MRAFLISLAVYLAASSAYALPWLVRKDRWSDTDEKNFSNFVAALGASGCNTVDKCFKSPANPYRASDPRGAYFDADCGKFPYLLRGYFAWKNSLPFSYVSLVESSDGRRGDIRYSRNGNVVLKRRSLAPTRAEATVDGYRALKLMQDEVDTAMYRVDAMNDGAANGRFSDFYSVGVSRSSIRPGTVIYDPAGHAAVVFAVEADGRIRYFDAHPDKTVSHGVYGQKFARSRPGSGAGFKNFRPLVLSSSARGPSGSFLGGTQISLPFNKLPGYSLEQYFGSDVPGAFKESDWRKARFTIKGRAANYYDYVRTKMAAGELRYHLIEEMQNGMQALCADIQDRVTAVDTALATGIQNLPHPSNLPTNIFGSNGDWENFSSPSRDARLKTTFRELRMNVQEMVELFRNHDPRIEYLGTNLGEDLRTTYSSSATACDIVYTKSNGEPVHLSYKDIQDRLFALSFDPYQCAELRWGASDPNELSSCGDSTNKRAWYAAEQPLRNQIERTYDVQMGFSLRDLERRVSGSGPAAAPDVDLMAYVQSL